MRNWAADDAAGLGVSQSMRAQIAELARCQRNVQEGIDVTNTADGALAEINSMLIRARELCIEGANGIYTQTELDAISDELNELFDAIDQITAETRHNDIQLFRFDGQFAGSGVKKKYDYVDHFSPVDKDNLVEWGEMSWISEKDFDPPTKGTPATVTMTFDRTVDVKNAASLDGKSLTINGFSYTFRKSGGISYGSIPVYDGESVQDAMDRLVRRAYGTIDKAEVNGNQVTFTASLDTLSRPTDVNRIQVNFEAEEADAEWAHNVTVGSYETDGTPALGETGITQGKTTYTTEVSNTPKPLANPKEPIGKDNAKNLNQNKLQVYIDPKNPIEIDFSTVTPPFDENTTWEELTDWIANELDRKNLGVGNPIEVSYGPDGISIKVTGLDENKFTPVEIKEITKAAVGEPTIQKPVDPPKIEELEFKTQFKIDIEEKSTFDSTYETLQSFKITIPDDIPYEPFAVCVNGENYYFYDSSREKFPTMPEGEFKFGNSLPGSLTDLKGKSPDKIKKLIYDTVRNGLRQGLGNHTGFYTIENGSSFLVVNEGKGDKIEIENTGLPQNSKLTAVQTQPPEKNPDYVEPSKAVLGNIPGLTGTLSQKIVETQITLDLGESSTFDLKNLVGKGGMIAGKYFEFVDKADSGLRERYEDLNIADFKSFEGVKDYFATLLTGYDVKLENHEVDVNGAKETHTKLVVAKKGSIVSWTDGDPGSSKTDGLFSNGPGDTVRKNFSGGKNGGYSSTILDFSGINDDNKEEKLLGKGFRITCASCSGEYINIFFCRKKDADTMPESFDIIDPDTNEKRTIHNIAVELSKFSDGQSIVENIVSQLTPELNHFTAVEVGDPPTQLIARDTRLGDVRDNNGNILRARVLTGVRTNFEYDYDKVDPDKKPSPDSPDGTGSELEVDFREMLIYAGSEPDHQWIPIHLPYLDLPTMNLRPPTMVDLGGGDDPFDWLDRVDAANGLIITSRTRIGADYNRLEHTYGALTQTRENMEASESRIRDADMAKLMVQYMKDEIIGQAQQSMMVHSNERPQQILELLK